VPIRSDCRFPILLGAGAMGCLFGARLALAGNDVTNYPSDLRGPGSVASHGSGYVRIAGLGGDDGAPQQAIAALLRDAGFDCVLDRGVERAIWEKVAFNAALNSLAAVTRLTVGGVGGTPAGHTLARRIVVEVCTVARARGIAVDEAATWASVERAFAEVGVEVPVTEVLCQLVRMVQ
jgi:2-dehydropantoate 2-reductase